MAVGAPCDEALYWSLNILWVWTDITWKCCAVNQKEVTPLYYGWVNWLMFNLLSKIRPKWLVQTSLSQLFAVVLLITLKVAKAVVVFWGRAGFCSFQQHVGGNKPLFPGLFVCIFVFFLFSFHLLSSLNVILLIWLAIFKHKWAVGLFLRFCPPPLLSHLSFATSHGKRLCLERISDFFWGSNRYCSWLQLAGLHWSTHYNFISCHYWQQNPRWCDTYFPPKKKPNN